MVLSHQSSTNHTPRRAAAAVEFAVVAPVLFAVVFGSIEFGRAMMVGHLVNNAARAGCREGALPNKSTADVQAAVTNSLQGAGVQGGSVTVLVNGVEQDASLAATGDRVEVKVTVAADQNSWLPGLSFLRGQFLSGTTVMRRE
jgi:Flp pilus assembly protein TadG